VTVPYSEPEDAGEIKRRGSGSPPRLNSTGVYAFHAEFLLSRDNETSAEPHLGAQDHKAGQESGPTLFSFHGAANAPEARK
jgi:hypothetical protein